MPLDVVNGLAYLKIRPYTDQEYESLPHVVLTSDDKWDPQSVDVNLSDDPNWTNMVTSLRNDLINSPFDEYGRYRYNIPHPSGQLVSAMSIVEVNYHQMNNINTVLMLI